MPTNNFALFCIAVFFFAFAYYRADFGFVLSAAIQSLFQQAELTRKNFNGFLDHSNTATNILKLLCTITSIYFGWGLRLTTPISGKLRPSPKLDSNTVEAIRAYAENQELQLVVGRLEEALPALRRAADHKLEEEERKVIAYHEAGHAILMYFDEHSEPLHKVTIIPRGPSLGATYLLPEKDRNLSSRNQLLARMRSSYGGRIAEHMFCGDMYNGTAGDIRMATNIARAMVT